ncbi:MAG TPA: DUF58 domain-containing protein [Candidatus Thermoplasmatota archaeon]|nr:DUF58 domain-containing protein [Candidatus Thermoplasmatota archaeon]
MLTRRGADLGLATLLLGAASGLGYAWGAQAPWLLALLALPLVAALAWSALLTALVRPRLHVERGALAERHLVGDTPTMTVRLRKAGFLPGLLEVLDDLPRGLAVAEGANHGILAVPSQGHVELRYRLDLSVRGRYTLPGLRWRWRAPLGAFALEGTVAAPVTLTVVPRSDGLEYPLLRASSSSHLLGPHQQRVAGGGTEFWGLRDYRTDDPYDRINWKATARRGSLVVSEHEQEAPADYVLIVDARALTGRGAPASVLEMNIRGALGLAEDLLRRGQKVGLLVYGDGLTWIYPEYGRKQYAKLQETLLAVQPRGSAPLMSLVTETPPALIPYRATCILFTTAWGDVRLLDGVEALTRRVRSLTVIYPFPQEAPLPVPDAASRVASLILQAELEAVCARTRAVGARAVPWPPGKPLSLAFEEVALR